MIEFTSQELLIIQGLVVQRIESIKEAYRMFIDDEEISNIYLKDYNETMPIKEKIEKILRNEVQRWKTKD